MINIFQTQYSTAILFGCEKMMYQHTPGLLQATKVDVVKVLTQNRK